MRGPKLLRRATERRRAGERRRAREREERERLECQLLQVLKATLAQQHRLVRYLDAGNVARAHRMWVMHPEWWGWIMRSPEMSWCTSYPVPGPDSGQPEELFGYPVSIDPSYGAPELR